MVQVNLKEAVYIRRSTGRMVKESSKKIENIDGSGIYEENVRHNLNFYYQKDNLGFPLLVVDLELMNHTQKAIEGEGKFNGVAICRVVDVDPNETFISKAFKTVRENELLTGSRD